MWLLIIYFLINRHSRTGIRLPKGEEFIFLELLKESEPLSEELVEIVADVLLTRTEVVGRVARGAIQKMS